MAPLKQILTCIALGAVLAAPGCNKKEPMPSPETAAPALPVDFGPPPTEAEAKEFAEQLNAAVDSRDSKKMDELLHMRDILERSFSDIPMSASERSAALTGVYNSLEQKGPSAQIVQALHANGTYRLLRIRTVDGRPHLVYRFLQEDGAVDFHEYTLARYADGKIGAEDLYTYSSGEMITQSIRRLTIPAFNQLSATKGFGFGNNAKQQELIKQMDALKDLAEEIRLGHFKEAIIAYKRLPQQLRENKTSMLMYLTALGHLGETSEPEYVAAMEKMRDLFPNDSCVDLVSIDYFILKKQFKQAVVLMDRIDRRVGGDPYLNVLAANTLIELKQFDESKRRSELAIAAEPDLQIAYWSRISASLGEKNHADTLRWLKKIVDEIGVEVQDLSDLPAYADFVKSDEFDEWRDWYKKHSVK